VSLTTSRLIREIDAKGRAQGEGARTGVHNHVPKMVLTITAISDTDVNRIGWWSVSASAWGLRAGSAGAGGRVWKVVW
jgi:hypothetical protein